MNEQQEQNIPNYLEQGIELGKLGQNKLAEVLRGVAQSLEITSLSDRANGKESLANSKVDAIVSIQEAAEKLNK